MQIKITLKIDWIQYPRIKTFTSFAVFLVPIILIKETTRGSNTKFCQHLHNENQILTLTKTRLFLKKMFLDKELPVNFY